MITPNRCVAALVVCSVALCAALAPSRQAAGQPGFCAQPVWVRSTMVPRTGHAMAYDSGRNRLVLFGGRAIPDDFTVPMGDALGDTWEFDGSVWRKVAEYTPDPFFFGGESAATGPLPRDGHALAYDPIRQKTVMWGGCCGDQNTVWEWNGATWTPVAPTSVINPPMRTGHAMAFDFVQQKVAMVGGDTSQQDHWAWNGAAWTQRPNLPQSLGLMSPGLGLASDPNRGRLIVTGGYLGANTYEFDGVRWNLRAVDSPGGVVSMSYDSVNRRTLLRSSNSEHVWGWNGATWVPAGTTTFTIPISNRPVAAWMTPPSGLISVDGSGFRQCDTYRAELVFSGLTGVATWVDVAPLGPPPRFDHSFSQVTDGGAQALFGGIAFPDFGFSLEHAGDAWQLADGYWTSLGSAVARFDHAAAGVGGSDTVFTQGGSDANGTTLAEHLVLAGAGFVSGAASPMARTGHALAYDSNRKRMVLFGGWDPDAGYTNSTFEYDTVNQTWFEMHAGGPLAPEGREQFGMAFDASRGRAVLFGGIGYDGEMGDTWEWDGAEWRQITPAFGDPMFPTGMDNPAPRAYHAMAYDTVRHRVALYGGQGTQAAINTTFSDLWEWNGTAWFQRGFGGPPIGVHPGARASHGLSFDTARGRLMLSAGIAPNLFDPFGGSFIINSDVLETASPALVSPTDLGPQSVSATENDIVQLTAYDPMGGYFPFRTRWLKNGVPLFEVPGSSVSCTSCPQLTIHMPVPGDAGVYQLASADGCGAYLSSPITLSVEVVSPPVITQQPVPPSQTVTPGETAQFTADAAGTPAPSLQWLRDGLPVSDDGRISGAQTGTLTIHAVEPGDMGAYSLMAFNFAGSVQSDAAMLTVAGAVCAVDYNTDGSLNSDDIGDFITDYFTAPALPGPGGYAIACPGNPAPYDAGYRAAYTIDGSGQCFEPNSDNLGDFITGYFEGCGEPG